MGSDDESRREAASDMVDRAVAALPDIALTADSKLSRAREPQPELNAESFSVGFEADDAAESKVG